MDNTTKLISNNIVKSYSKKDVFVEDIYLFGFVIFFSIVYQNNRLP